MNTEEKRKLIMDLLVTQIDPEDIARCRRYDVLEFVTEGYKRPEDNAELNAYIEAKYPAIKAVCDALRVPNEEEVITKITGEIATKNIKVKNLAARLALKDNPDSIGRLKDDVGVWKDDRKMALRELKSHIDKKSNPQDEETSEESFYSDFWSYVDTAWERDPNNYRHRLAKTSVEELNQDAQTMQSLIETLKEGKTLLAEMRKVAKAREENPNATYDMVYGERDSKKRQEDEEYRMLAQNLVDTEIDPEDVKLFSIFGGSENGPVDVESRIGYSKYLCDKYPAIKAIMSRYHETHIDEYPQFMVWYIEPHLVLKDNYEVMRNFRDTVAKEYAMCDEYDLVRDDERYSTTSKDDPEWEGLAMDQFVLTNNLRGLGVLNRVTTTVCEILGQRLGNVEEPTKETTKSGI